MLKPDIPHFGGRHRHRDLAFDALDLGDEFGDGQVLAIDRFVADDHAVDVGMTLGARDAALHLPLVSLLLSVEPDALAHVQAEIRSDTRHQLHAVGGRIGSDFPRIRLSGRETGSYPSLVGTLTE